MKPASPSRAALWLGAFTGFYRPAVDELCLLEPVSKFLYASRSVILVISAQAALILSARAWACGVTGPTIRSALARVSNTNGISAAWGEK